MILNPENTFRQLILFTNKIFTNKTKYKRGKIKNAISTTNFESMKKVEKDGQFDEKMRSEKTDKYKDFFFLGPKMIGKNCWTKNTIKSINEIFQRT